MRVDIGRDQAQEGEHRRTLDRLAARRRFAQCAREFNKKRRDDHNADAATRARRPRRVPWREAR
jgi:hypothetical protein